MWTDGNGFFYQGDCRIGDRAATATEVSTWQAAQTKAAFKLSAQTELDYFTGQRGMVIRCLSAGVAMPPAYTAYVQKLRAIINGTDTTSTALPARPVPVAGT